MLAIPTRSDAATRAGWVDVGDHVRIHYLQAGPDDASRTLLLIPGWTVSSSIWSKQIAYFEARGFRVIAVDSRSQGGSTVVTTGNAPENRAADIAQVIEQLKVRNLVLVGWSQGVQDVAAYVARYGAGKTDGFVLVDGPVSGGQDDVRGSPAFVAIIMRGMAAYSTDAHAYTDGLMHAIISTATPASVYTKLDEEASKTPVDVGVSMLMQDLFTKDRRSSLPLFSKPTLVIASAKSPLLDAQRNMLKSLPHAKLTVVENASHAVFFDQPDVFNHDLDGFIASLGAPQSAPSP
ncbi:alpha/beta fold hydrolase [Dyella mobilis]|uniref:Alpha/beta hydrolase n=1 Tax=Dyella mobilis TaxID=1849582 RepID=A0ABS2KEE6_9GAMM|nr:alpha/beta hydrolase [Dyella mobilis]MBM7129464.1 alpha/beta hydrolase [Dyella mobilis]